MKKIIYLALVMMVFFACKQESREELDPCYTGNVTYTNFIAPLVQNYNCIGCHNSRSAPNGINWEGYTNAKSAAMTGRVYGAVSHTPGYSPMPKSGGKLTDCEIKKMKAWIDAGAPE